MTMPECREGAASANPAVDCGDIGVAIAGAAEVALSRTDDPRPLAEVRVRKMPQLTQDFGNREALKAADKNPTSGEWK